MKLFVYRVSRGMLLLTFNMILVFTAAFLVIINLQARDEMEASKRGFYSNEADYLLCKDEKWEDLEKILTGGDWTDGLLFKKDLETGLDTRGIFYQGKIQKYPLQSGRFFTEEESTGNERKALIGKFYQKDVYEEEGKEYIEILGKSFEVIGVLGSAQSTRLDRMKWIPLETAVELNGMEGSYVVDGKGGSVQHNSNLLNSIMEKDEVMLDLRTVASSEMNWKEWISSVSANTVEKIFFAIIFAFILNMMLACSYWAKNRFQKIQVKKMLGFPGSRILLSVLAEYFMIAILSLAISVCILGILTAAKVVTIVSWIKCIPAIGAILIGGMIVITIRLSAVVVSRKIVLRRG